MAPLLSDSVLSLRFSWSSAQMQKADLRTAGMDHPLRFAHSTREGGRPVCLRTEPLPQQVWLATWIRQGRSSAPYYNVGAVAFRLDREDRGYSWNRCPECGGQVLRRASIIM